MIHRFEKAQGFTLIEMMAILAIVSVLVGLAIVLHQHALAKAQSVEAELVLDEIRRLEMVYYANHGVYSSDLNAIGFTLNASHRYYKIDVQLQHGGAAYHAMALPHAGSGKQIALLLTQSGDGQITLQKGDPIALSALTGRNQPSDQEVGGSNMGTGGSSSKPTCREGGEATVAQDGLLDMNFCLR